MKETFLIPIERQGGGHAWGKIGAISNRWLNQMLGSLSEAEDAIQKSWQTSCI